MFVANLKSAISTKQTIRSGVGGERDRMKDTNNESTRDCDLLLRLFIPSTGGGSLVLVLFTYLFIYLRRWDSNSNSSSRKA